MEGMSSMDWAGVDAVKAAWGGSSSFPQHTLIHSGSDCDCSSLCNTSYEEDAPLSTDRYAKHVGPTFSRRRVSAGCEDSLDSSLSEQDVLLCEEDLQCTEGPSTPSCASQPALAEYQQPESPSPSACMSDVYETISNELFREAELRPSSEHLDRHPALTVCMRCVTVSWLVEVAAEFELQQETLFLAVTYFSRYLSVSQGVPQGMVQLVAVACISLAAKQEEVEQFTATNWTDVAAGCFQNSDLVRMEWLVLNALDWRGRVPTAYSFLHLFCHALSSCSTLTICIASYLAELSLLDYGLVEYPYSVIACASLLLAQLMTDPSGCNGSSAAAAAHALQCLAPEMDMASVCACMGKLEALHRCTGCAGEVERFAAQGPVRQKYSGDEWQRAAKVVAMAAMAPGQQAPLCAL